MNNIDNDQFETTCEVPLTELVIHREGEFPYAFLPQEFVGSEIRRDRDGAIGKIESYIEDYAEIIVNIGGYRRRVGLANWPETDCYTVLAGRQTNESADPGSFEASETSTFDEGSDEYMSEIEGKLRGLGYEDVRILTRLNPQRRAAEWYADDDILSFRHLGAFVKCRFGGNGMLITDDAGNTYRSPDDLVDKGIIDDDGLYKLMVGDGVDCNENDCEFVFDVYDSEDNYVGSSWETNSDSMYILDELMCVICDEEWLASVIRDFTQSEALNEGSGDDAFDSESISEIIGIGDFCRTAYDGPDGAVFVMDAHGAVSHYAEMCDGRSLTPEDADEVADAFSTKLPKRLEKHAKEVSDYAREWIGTETSTYVAAGSSDWLMLFRFSQSGFMSNCDTRGDGGASNMPVREALALFVGTGDSGLVRCVGALRKEKVPYASVDSFCLDVDALAIGMGPEAGDSLNEADGDSDFDASEPEDGKDGADAYADSVRGMLASAGYEDVEMLGPIYPRRDLADWYDYDICRMRFGNCLITAYAVGSILLRDVEGNEYESARELEGIGVVDDDSLMSFLDDERNKGNDDPYPFCDRFFEVKAWEAGHEGDVDYLGEHDLDMGCITTLNALWYLLMTSGRGAIRNMCRNLERRHRGPGADAVDEGLGEDPFEVGSANGGDVDELIAYLDGFAGRHTRIGDDVYFIREYPTEERKELALVATFNPDGSIRLRWPAWSRQTVEEGEDMERKAIADVESGTAPDMSGMAGYAVDCGSIKGAINALSRRYGLESYKAYRDMLSMADEG